MWILNLAGIILSYIERYYANFLVVVAPLRSRAPFEHPDGARLASCIRKKTPKKPQKTRT